MGVAKKNFKNIEKEFFRSILIGKCNLKLVAWTRIQQMGEQDSIKKDYRSYA